MNPDWLAQLAPAHAPPAAPWWPPAPGWWWLAFLLLVGVAGFVYGWTRPQQRLRRASLRGLAVLKRAGHDDVALAVGLQDLLRRHAVACYGREAVAKLSGAAWLAFLGEHGAAALAGEAGAALLRAAYAFDAAGATWQRSRAAAGETAAANVAPAASKAQGTQYSAIWLAAARGFIRYRAKSHWWRRS